MIIIFINIKYYIIHTIQGRVTEYGHSRYIRNHKSYKKNVDE